MHQTTFQDYLERRLCHDFKLEDPFTQLEYILTSMDDPGYKARLAAIAYKSSVEFLKVMYGYRDLLGQQAMLFHPLQFDGRELISAATIADYFYGLGSSLRIHHRIELVRDWLLKEISSFSERELHEPWVEEAIDLLEPEDYQRGYKQLKKLQRDTDPTFDDFEKEKDILSRMVVERKLKPLRSWVRGFHFVDVQGLYKQLFTNEPLFWKLSRNQGVPTEWGEICQQTVENLDAQVLTYEDATPFLYLKELLQGLHVNTSVRHVIVDEAQDYSPIQLEFLKQLFPRSRMTALGDLNQAIYAHTSAMAEMEPLLQLYKPEQTEVIRLTNSYRSTKEIVEFTKGMVSGGEEIQPFRRTGEKPKVAVVRTRSDQIQLIVRELEALHELGYESIAVICKTAEESANAYAMLSEYMSLRLITKDSLKFEKESLVIPAYLAKGVEFDAVIIYDASSKQYSREQERNLFYTACTRAMHNLKIYSLGELSPFITAQSPTTYVLEPVRV